MFSKTLFSTPRSFGLLRKSDVFLGVLQGGTEYLDTLYFSVNLLFLFSLLISMDDYLPQRITDRSGLSAEKENVSLLENFLGVALAHVLLGSSQPELPIMNAQEAFSHQVPEKPVISLISYRYDLLEAKFTKYSLYFNAREKVRRARNGQDWDFALSSDAMLYDSKTTFLSLRDLIEHEVSRLDHSLQVFAERSIIKSGEVRMTVEYGVHENAVFCPLSLDLCVNAIPRLLGGGTYVVLTHSRQDQSNLFSVLDLITGRFSLSPSAQKSMAEITAIRSSNHEKTTLSKLLSLT